VKKLSVLVVGAGAVGSVVGGMLAKAGHHVSMLGRQPHMSAIAQQGLEISGVIGKHKVRNIVTYTSATDIPQQHFDLILVTTKSYDTQQALRGIVRLISSDSVLISLQNGLGNMEIIADFVGAERTLGVSVMFGAVIKAPGSVEVTANPESLKLGSIGAMPLKQVESIAEIFAKSGVACEATPEIMKYIWGKLLLNCCLNALSAILEFNYRELWESHEVREIQSSIIKEVFAVARAKGIELAWHEPKEYEHPLFEFIIPQSFAHISSMFQDIRQGKRTEIDAINGAIARLSKELGLSTPTNELLTKLVKAKEKQQRKRLGKD
jgi:2-dehydropantoate 2-reductase